MDPADHSHAPKPRRGAMRLALNTGQRVWELGERLVLGLLPLVFGGLALFMVIREAAREPIEVSEVSVPPALAETGFTPSVAAHRLLDAINATARAVRTETMHRPNAELEGSEPDLNIPAAGLSLHGLAALVRNLLGWPQRRLSGEIIANGESLRLRLRLAGHGVIADFQAPANDGADALLVRAAPEIFRVVSPRLYAWHIAQSDAEQEDIRDRLILLRRRTDDDDTEATLDYLIARSLVISGRTQEALELLDPYVTEQPHRAAGHYGRAMALRAQGDREGALEAQRRGLSLDPNAAWAHLSSAVLLRELGRFDDALAAVREAQRLDDDDRDELTEEAHILRFMGRASDAAATARRALALDPGFAPAHAAIGHSLLGQRDVPAALAAFESALNLAPRLAEGHTGRGEALAALGRDADALDALARAVELDGSDHRPHRALGELLSRREQWEEALAAYDRAIARAPTIAGLYLGRGLALARLGRRPEAVEALRGAMALGLDDAVARQLLAELEVAAR